MADSRSDCVSVFCLCTAFTEFRTLLPVSRWGPERSLLQTLLTVPTGEVPGGVPGPSLCPLNMGVKSEDRTLVNRLLSHSSVSCLYLLLFLFLADEAWCHCIFYPSCNLQLVFIHWFAAPPPNDKRLFSIETLLCESWKSNCLFTLSTC